jgi:hypothetical protein
MNVQAPIVIYLTKNGQTKIEVKFDHETLWLSLQQIAELFERDKSVISRHIKSIFDSGELIREATLAKNATAQLLINSRLLMQHISE